MRRSEVNVKTKKAASTQGCHQPQTDKTPKDKFQT